VVVLQLTGRALNPHVDVFLREPPDLIVEV
jgi:hypothetical protein